MRDREFTPADSRPALSVIMPLHDNWESCQRALDALRALRPPPAEIILVQDGAMRRSPGLAWPAQASLVSTGEHTCKGPGAARNAGAQYATGDILVFLDSDVVVPPHLLTQVLAAFQCHPHAAAVFGSYDDAPAAPNFLSQYRNLLHHFTHQTSRPDVSTFWTGCGAIRAEVFRALGGFVEDRRVLEDVELGFRMKRQGYSIRLCRHIQVKHLKRYTASSLLRSDILGRAVPWSRLVLGPGFLRDELVLQRSQRISALLVGVLAVSLAATLLSSWSIWCALATGAALLFLNRSFYFFLARRRGWLFVPPSIFWHWLYFFYASVTFACIALARSVAPARAPSRKEAHALRPDTAPSA